MVQIVFAAEMSVTSRTTTSWEPASVTSARTWFDGGAEVHDVPDATGEACGDTVMAAGLLAAAGPPAPPLQDATSRARIPAARFIVREH
jgi:hypothetical protein